MLDRPNPVCYNTLLRGNRHVLRASISPKGFLIPAPEGGDEEKGGVVRCLLKFRLYSQV